MEPLTYGFSTEGAGRDKDVAERQERRRGQSATFCDTASPDTREADTETLLVTLAPSFNGAV
jgi:hypothetical protein